MKKKLISALLLACLSFPAFVGAVDLHNLKASSNDPNGDYYLGSEAELKPAIQSAVQDNSLLNPIELYLAANTALRLNLLQEAGFLFYAAQIRKAFDIKRFNLPVPNGNNVRTYLDFLNHTIGQNLNPAIMGSPADFAKAIDRIATWNPVPDAKANYPKQEFGVSVIAQKDWQGLGDAMKQDFMNAFGLKMKGFLSVPKNAAAFKMVQDFNLGRIPNTPENRKNYEEALKVVQASGM